jgi:hypothetical protein
MLIYGLMSSQTIELDLRHAIWLTHNRRCVYCSEPLSFSEVEIDHVIPEVLVGTPELPVIIARLDLPPAFDLFSIRNLLPAHRRCNLVKSSKVFDDAAARFFLHRAEGASANIQELVAKKKQGQTRDNLLAKLGEAIRSGLILPMDIQESQAPHLLRLTNPLVFADAPAEIINSIVPEEVERYLDRPVLMGGDPVFAADFGDDKGVRMSVRTCREYRAALAAGFSAQTTYDIKSEAVLKTVNSILTAAGSVRLPISSYIRRPHRGVADLQLLPCSVLPCVSPDDAEIIADMENASLGDLLGRGEIKILGISSSELSLEWNWGLMLREICRADFDGDGIEDILCECYCWATEGTLGFGWTSILARTSENSGFVVNQL